MHLKVWREQKRETRAQLAERINRSVEAVRRYEEGERIPDRETMSLIVGITDGCVTPNDFFGLSTPATCGTCDEALYLRRQLRDRVFTNPSMVVAVAGTTTAQILATQVPAVLSGGLKAGDIVYLDALTNDVGNVTWQQTMANMDAILTAFTNVGATVVVVGVVPQSAWTTSKRQTAAELNRQCRLRARTYAGGVVFFDPNLIYTNYATGNAASGNQYSDNVHDSPTAALIKAQGAYAIIDRLVAPANEVSPLAALTSDFDATLAPYGNMLINGAMAQDTGGSLIANGSAAAPGGTASTGIAKYFRARWGSSSATTMTATFTRGTDPNNASLPTQIITLGGTADGNILQLQAANDNVNAGVAVPTGVVAGTLIEAGAEISWTGLTGVKEIELRLSLYTAAGEVIRNQDGAQFTPSATTDLPLPTAHSGRFRVPQAAIPAGWTGTGWEIRVNGISGAALGGVITISRPTLGYAQP